MFHPPSNTARTHAQTSISTLKSLVNFCSRDFLFHKEFDDSTLAKRHIVVGHFVRSDTGHVMQAIDVTRHSRITQLLVLSTTTLSFVCCSQFVCKKKVAHDFRYDPRILRAFNSSVLEKFYGKWIISVFRGCTSCNTRMNVPITLLSNVPQTHVVNQVTAWYSTPHIIRILVFKMKLCFLVQIFLCPRAQIPCWYYHPG